MIHDLTEESCDYVCRNMRDTDRWAIFGLRWTDDMDEFCANRWGNRGSAWEAIRGGQPCAIGGINHYVPKCVSLWFIGTNSWRRVMIEVTHFIKMIMIPRLILDGHRIECAVLAGDNRALAYAKMLGFKEEGMSRKVGRYGADYFQMAIVQ